MTTWLSQHPVEYSVTGLAEGMQAGVQCREELGQSRHVLAKSGIRDSPVRLCLQHSQERSADQGSTAGRGEAVDQIQT